ncbi:carboxymethylenebutenolidase homolog [Ptychodera flava]|uniref:carboxymethylenebutenolidase homolog n=1 Tax=Ptychodera flava TaxID=63121 RepID=UPI00396A940A
MRVRTLHKSTSRLPSPHTPVAKPLTEIDPMRSGPGHGTDHRTSAPTRLLTLQVKPETTTTVTNESVDNKMATGKLPEPDKILEEVQARGEDIEITSDLKAYLSRPLGNLKLKGALILMSDMSGYSTSTSRLLADSIAEKGYTILMPNFFRNNPWNQHSGVNPLDPTKPSMFSDPYEEWLASHPQDRVDGDMDASLDYLQQNLSVSSVSVIGFCWGGFQVMLASGKYADKFRAAVGFYAVKIAPNMVEIALAMNTPTLLMFGELDKIMPLDTISEMENAVREANRLTIGASGDNSKLDGPAVKIKVFKGVGHAFAHRGTDLIQLL